MRDEKHSDRINEATSVRFLLGGQRRNKQLDCGRVRALLQIFVFARVQLPRAVACSFNTGVRLCFFRQVFLASLFLSSFDLAFV